MSDTVWVYLVNSLGIGGRYYGPGLVEAPRAVAETISQNRGVTIEQLEAEAQPYREQAAREAEEAEAEEAQARGDSGLVGRAAEPEPAAVAPAGESEERGALDDRSKRRGAR